jgi:hypothetical protein
MAKTTTRWKLASFARLPGAEVVTVIRDDLPDGGMFE